MSSVTPQKTTSAVDIDEESSDEEIFDYDAHWNWREDKRWVLQVFVAISCLCSNWSVHYERLSVCGGWTL